MEPKFFFSLANMPEYVFLGTQSNFDEYREDGYGPFKFEDLHQLKMHVLSLKERFPDYPVDITFCSEQK